jgi:hypothetical protein
MGVVKIWSKKILNFGGLNFRQIMAVTHWIYTNFLRVPPHSEVLLTSIQDSQLKHVHTWSISSRLLLLLVLS